jgi:hypothetical protein
MRREGLPTMNTPHRRLFGSISRSFGVCGAAGMKAGPSNPKNHAEFPGIIMEINGLRRVATDP